MPQPCLYTFIPLKWTFFLKDGSFLEQQWTLNRLVSLHDEASLIFWAMQKHGAAPFSGDTAAPVNISISVLQQKPGVWGWIPLNILLCLDAVDVDPIFPPPQPTSTGGKHCKEERPCLECAPSWNSNAHADFTSAKSNLSNKIWSLSRGRSPLIRIHSGWVLGCSVVTLPRADWEDFLLCCSCSEADEHHLDRSGWNEIFICTRRERRF